MGFPHPAPPVKLIVGLLGADPDLLRRARQLLSRRYGPVDASSAQWPFTATTYYEPEMGAGLLRQFLSFEPLIRPEALADIKRETNELEREIAEQALAPGSNRPVNIDPGYIDLGKLVLATTKDRAHRIYLGLGIYAEVTLGFEGGAWRPAAWTYPDYQQAHYHEFFTAVRQRCHVQRCALADRLAARADTRPDSDEPDAAAQSARPDPRLSLHPAPSTDPDAAPSGRTIRRARQDDATIKTPATPRLSGSSPAGSASPVAPSAGPDVSGGADDPAPYDLSGEDAPRS